MNVSEQYNRGVKVHLGMIAFLSSPMKWLKECDPSMLSTFASFSLSYTLVHIILVPWCIGFHGLETIQMKTLVYGWLNGIVIQLMVHVMWPSYISMLCCVLPI